MQIRLRNEGVSAWNPRFFFAFTFHSAFRIFCLMKIYVFSFFIVFMGIPSLLSESLKKIQVVPNITSIPTIIRYLPLSPSSPFFLSHPLFFLLQKVEKAGKKELDRILLNMNLEIDNPCVVMTQETSKVFCFCDSLSLTSFWFYNTSQ